MKKDINHWLPEAVMELIDFMVYWEFNNKLNPELFPNEMTTEKWEINYIEWRKKKGEMN